MDLGAFLDAELRYYDRCRDILLQLKQSWPAGSVITTYSQIRRLIKLAVKVKPMEERIDEILVLAQTQHMPMQIAITLSKKSRLPFQIVVPLSALRVQHHLKFRPNLPGEIPMDMTPRDPVSIGQRLSRVPRRFTEIIHHHSECLESLVTI